MIRVMTMKQNLDNACFDHLGRYVIPDYSRARPFASFLPGIAGPLGIPMWVFTVNRGQAIASFGVENKDNPIIEFQSADKAYQTTPYTGFRTFLKLTQGEETTLYEPFSPWQSADAPCMFIGMNELELQTTSAIHSLQTNVLYFTLVGEPFAGLVRQVMVKNLGDRLIALEVLDGISRVIPYGVNNWALKEISRTLEAWMAVFNLEERVPYYRLGASVVDTVEVEAIRAGHFYLAFDDAGQLLLPFVDPVAVFGQNTSLSMPDRFAQHPLTDLSCQAQITTGRTPCGFFGASATLEPGQTLTLYAIIGHVADIAQLHRQQARLAQPGYVQQKREQAEQLVNQLTDVVHTQTASPLFDAYTRQTFLDNVLRGGWPLILGREEKPFVYHIYSRKHGDLERDYNHFYVAAEPYSQGNANYRDVNQNRRCDVLLNPQVKDYNVLAFLGLIQADGYNPLVVNGSRFTVPAEHRAPILVLVKGAGPEPVTGLDMLEQALSQPFTPGGLLRTITDRQVGLTVPPEVFLAEVLSHAEQHFEATFHEGYWVDHWFYNLDLIDTYLAIYPDKKEELLFGRPISFFDSPAVVQPRTRKYVLTADGRVRQYGAVREDEEKAALIASRAQTPNLMRTAHGQGEVYRTTVFAKLVGLALVKFATLDPLGMGIEMEAGRPGWYDALNGLPGLFGSSLCETYELERLLAFLLETMAEKRGPAVSAPEQYTVRLPVEQAALLEAVAGALADWETSAEAAPDLSYWEAVVGARETYRRRIRLGFDGATTPVSFEELTRLLTACQAKVRAGIGRAVEMNDGIPPTYFAYTVTDYEVITGEGGEPLRDQHGRPYVRAKAFESTVLPLFLEGPVHALKVQPEAESARRLYGRVRGSALFDRELKMYKVNAPLEGQSHEIGRARAFTPGWLENESVWLHMEYKYLLEALRAGLYDEFFADLRNALVPFLDPETYGRSPLENSSFIVSSAHPDGSLHGAGFVARLSGATAEFLHMWTVMMAGARPFFLRDGELCLQFRPALPGWLFTDESTLSFSFLGQCRVTYHNPGRLDTWHAACRTICLLACDGQSVSIEGDVIPMPLAGRVRSGQVQSIDIYLENLLS
jgi:hypothetical protein